MQTEQMIDPAVTRQNAVLEELQLQRTFLGDRAANLAADLAVKNSELALANSRIEALTKERDEWKSKVQQEELPLET